MRPFLKWLGNKYRLLNQITPFLPKGERLVEPFAGSAAMFLNTNYSSYLLAEKSPHLIELYQELQSHGDKFIQRCEHYFSDNFNNESSFYELREKFNRSKSIKVRSPLFLYLNRHGYNGLCRFNSKGKFNVPFGRYDKPYFPKKEMQHFYQKSAQAHFICADYKETLSQLKKGDVVYCDPPYVPLSHSANFSQYTASPFNHQEQEALATKAKELAQSGISVLISNHDLPITRELYQGAAIHSFDIRRTVSCHGHKRQKVKELLAVFTARY